MQYFRAQSCAYDNDVTQPKTPLADFTSPTISTRLGVYQIKFKCNLWLGAVVVSQLVERSLPTPEVRGSNPVIGKFNVLSAILKTVLKRR